MKYELIQLFIREFISINLGEILICQVFFRIYIYIYLIDIV